MCERFQRIYRAPQEPTSSLLRSGANIGKKELQGEDEEEGVEEVQGGHEGRRSQEVKPKRLMEKAGVANNLRGKKVSSKKFLSVYFSMQKNSPHPH